MSDNVIILGAGASFDARIPLMADFVETMWEFAIRGTAYGVALSSTDKKIFEEAMEIRGELDSYHGRASFDDRNLEDILSILSFDEFSGQRGSTKRLSSFTKAISRTIELCCNVGFSSDNAKVNLGSSIYRAFWQSLIRLYKTRRSWPTIISFNYDLVLERTLYHLFTGLDYSVESLPFNGITIKYECDTLLSTSWSIHQAAYTNSSGNPQEGTAVAFASSDAESVTGFELLKLHGSLNFPNRKTKTPGIPLCPVDAPLIMPPIFNKMADGRSLKKVWSTALKRLRNAKNVIIVGYSLPRTDIYMQYFLKAALGPNINLNRIYVFDPVLYRNNEDSERMIARYTDCFSQQMQHRIIFAPLRLSVPTDALGSFYHFSERVSDGSVLF